MSVEQLLFDLPRRTAQGRAEFFVSDANRDALGLIDRWPHWPERRLALVGAEGSGKSHLAAVWAADTGARIVAARDLTPDDVPALQANGRVVVEGLDAIDGRAPAEEALFHMINLVAAEGEALLLTARTPPAQARWHLPDLASRLAASTMVALQPPDDALLQAVLAKLFRDRQLTADDGVIPYLATRMERTLAAASRTVDMLDEAAMRGHKRLTARFAGRVLGWRDDPASRS
ncbi:MAG: DnaA/Hda family protein [Pseudomonadota bacterium]